jgi:hypothetical protein
LRRRSWGSVVLEGQAYQAEELYAAAIAKKIAAWGYDFLKMSLNIIGVFNRKIKLMSSKALKTHK